MAEQYCRHAAEVLVVLAVVEAGTHRRTDLAGRMVWVHQEAGSLRERSCSQVAHTVLVMRQSLAPVERCPLEHTAKGYQWA